MKKIPVTNPYNGRVVGEVPLQDGNQVREVLTARREYLPIGPGG